MKLAKFERILRQQHRRAPRLRTWFMHWGNALNDPTYRKATRRSVADRNLYRERMGLQRPLTLAQRRLARRR